MARQKNDSQSSNKGDTLRKRNKPTACPHVANVGLFGKETISTTHICYSCQDETKAKWICLHGDCCKDIKKAAFCGTRDRAHHTAHKSSQNDHIVFLHAVNHRLYCFECDLEISRDYNVPEIPASLRRCLLKRGRQVSKERGSSPGKKLVVKEGTPKPKNQLAEADKARGAPLEKEASCGRPLMKQMEDEFEDDYPKGLTGMKNLVNTCYFNAAIQVLSNCPPFSDFFRDKGDLRPYSFHEPVVSRSLNSTIQKLWSPKRDLSISPDLLLLGVRERFPQFRGWSQQDAQELIRCLLEQVHKEMGQPIYRYETMPSSLIVKKGRRNSSTSSAESDQFETADSGWSSDGDTPSTSMESRSDRKSREADEKKNREPVGWRSIVTDVFDGTIESSVKCLTCKTVSNTAETFQDLSLPIPSREQLNKLAENPVDDEHFSSMGGEREGAWSWWSFISSLFVAPPISLHDCLSAFFSPDRLVGDDMYSCEKCKKLRNGVKTCRIVRAPEILSVHLKRFRHDAFASSKISTRVSFPLCDLDISSFCSPDEKNTMYDLCGFVSHEGSSMDCGHYLAYCKNEIDGNWYEYDDSTVTKLDTAYVMTKEAYVLFYQKRNSLMEDIRMDVAQAVSPPSTTKTTTKTYISAEWLLKLNTFADPGPISNFSFLCQHGHILPRRANHITNLCTQVPSQLAERLYCEFGGGPRVDKLHYCLICNKRWQWLAEKKFAEHQKYRKIDEAIQAAMFTDEKLLYSFYMNQNVLSRAWYQAWQRFVSDPILEPPGPIDNSALVQRNSADEVVLNPKASFIEIPREKYLFFASCYGGGPEVFLTRAPQPTVEELEKLSKEADIQIEQAKSEAERRLQANLTDQDEEQLNSSL